MSDSYTTRKLSRMGRRRFLSALGGLGLSASALSAMSQETMANLVDDPKSEVPRVRGYVHSNHEAVKRGASPERTPIFYTISRDRWRRVESAHDARRKVEKQLEREFDAPSPVWVSTDSNGDKKIVVEQHDDGYLETEAVHQLERTVPSSVDGVAGRGSDFETRVSDIPVEIERVEVPKPDAQTQSIPSPPSCEDWDDDIDYVAEWDYVPAGAAIFPDFSPDQCVFTHGTAGFPVDYGGNKNLLTAGHVVRLNGASPGGVRLTTRKQDQNGDPDYPDLDVSEDVINDTSSNPMDAARLIPMSGTSVNYRYALSSGGGTSGPSITGSLAQDRLKDLEDQGSNSDWAPDEDVVKRGSRTGYDHCSIEKVNSNAFKTDLLGGSDELKEGDSGGPISVDYRYGNDTWSLAAGLVSSGGEGEPVSATSLPAIENAFNVRV